MKKIKPPRARRKLCMATKHGHVRRDYYTWLQDPKSKEVLQHIKAENVYAQEILRPTEKLQKTLYKEMKARIVEDDVSVLIKKGKYFYYTRTKKGKQHPIHCRKRGLRGKEEVILDENILSKREKYFSLGDFAIHPKGHLLAYTTDVTGNEKYALSIKDLKTGKIIETINASISQILWTADGNHLMYTKEKHPFPARKVYLHKLSDTKSDVCIYSEGDSGWTVSIGKSKSDKYIFITSQTFKESETWILPAKAPFGTQPIVMAKRRKDIYYYVTHLSKYFYIVTNEKALNYKVMQVSVKTPQKKYWKEWLPHQKNRSIDNLVVHKSFLALEVRENGLPEIHIYPLRSKNYTKIKLPEHEHSVSIYSNLEFVSEEIYLMYSSFLTPPTTLSYNAKTKKLKIKKQKKIPGFSKNKYETKRIWIKNDSIKIPVELFYKKGTVFNGKAPLLLHAYGSYGISIDPAFSDDRQSLIDRGWVFALAHPRGGGELGESWHKEAYLLTKKHTAEDFIVVARYLSEKKYTSSDRLAIMGGSAGGMLMGMVLNNAPNVCAAALVYVPFVDVVTSMLDETLPGTEIHYTEIGDPNKKNHYTYMCSYCPYENISKQEYPSILTRSSFHDIRIPYWEAAKWVSKIRAYKTDKNPVLSLTELHGGHFGKSGRYEWYKNRALDYAFLIYTIQGIDGKKI